jgi:hypothetical protein
MRRKVEKTRKSCRLAQLAFERRERCEDVPQTNEQAVDLRTVRERGKERDVGRHSARAVGRMEPPRVADKQFELGKHGDDGGFGHAKPVTNLCLFFHTWPLQAVREDSPQTSRQNGSGENPN